MEKVRKPTQPGRKFDIEELRNPDVACSFLSNSRWEFRITYRIWDDGRDMDTMITAYNTTLTGAANKIFGKEYHRRKPWITKDVLDLCDEREGLKKRRHIAEGATAYRKANKRIQKVVKEAKGDWIGAQCEEIETCLNKNNSKRSYQHVTI